MDFAALQVFKAVADEGGISFAAKKLHRVQSNVTTRIQQLEASLGTQLFVREKRRLFLSPAGELFLKYVEQLLQLSEQARSAVMGDAPRGVLRIGTLESTAASRLPPLLSRYHKRYPGVHMELTTGTTDALVDAVISRKVEAAFVANYSGADPLETMPVFVEELVVIAPKTHLRIRSAGDVRTDTIISFPYGCAYRRLLQGWLATGGIAPEKILELSSYHAIVACVASGTGIAIVPRSVLATTSASADVAAYPVTIRKGGIVTSLIWRKGEISLPLKVLLAELAKRKRKT